MSILFLNTLFPGGGGGGGGGGLVGAGFSLDFDVRMPAVEHQECSADSSSVSGVSTPER